MGSKRPSITVVWSLLILIIVALLPQMAKAQNNTQRETSTYVTASQAMDIGYAFMRTGTGSRSGGTQSNDVRRQAMQLVYTGQATDSLTGAVTDCYYVFALQPTGFVMVAADERVEPILGYSYDNGFVVENMPEQVRGWLDYYARQIEEAVKSDFHAEPATQSKWTRLKNGQSICNRNGVGVGPLLQTTWNQNSPYNLWCPSDEDGPNGHVYAGCVATAMAQIMRYWQYPTNGIGSHSYNANYTSQGYGNYGTQSANFAATTYHYSLMPLSLNNNTPTEQINEVAQLIYHCGVAVNMMYGSGGSGAYINDAVSAFRNYFGYSNATMVSKSSYTASAWMALLKEDLDNLRPIYYSGHGSGGHAFVCDGYDDQDNFHFNWGWSGTNNGFYTLSSLTPGNHDYSSSNMAIIGVDASVPMIHVGNSSLTFLTEAGSVSSSKPVSLLAAHLSSNITATVTGNFRISTDDANFYTSRTLSSSGGTLYVRYQPTGTAGAEEGYVALSSGTVKDTIFLTGVIYDNTLHCLPPTNLSISSQDYFNVSLQWNEPTIDPDPQTLSWSSNSIYTNYGYSSSDYQKTMLQRFDNADLAPYHNKALTNIKFVARPGATVYKAVVYKGGSYNGDYNPGTLVLSQDINVGTVTSGTWKTVTLNTPIIVDASEELWFGIYVEAPSGTYCMPVNSQAMPKKGCICGTHSSSGSVSWSEFKEEYSFCIIGTVKNVQTVTDYTVARNGTTIGTTTNTSMTDVVNGGGTFAYTVTANWDNGCSAMVSGNVEVPSGPLFEFREINGTDSIRSMEVCQGEPSMFEMYLYDNSEYPAEPNDKVFVDFQIYKDGVAMSDAELAEVMDNYDGTSKMLYDFDLSVGAPNISNMTMQSTMSAANGFIPNISDFWVMSFSYDWFYMHFFLGTENADHSHNGRKITVNTGVWKPGSSGVYTFSYAVIKAGSGAAINSGLSYNGLKVLGGYGSHSGLTVKDTLAADFFTIYVKNISTGDTTATVCENFDWYGMHLTQSGDYTHTLTNAAGCDSIVTLHLTVNTPTEGDTIAIVCDSFDWYGAHLTQSGDYTQRLTNAAGCDSVVTLHLTVNPTYEVTDAQTICASELPYTWNNVQFTEAGTQTTTLPTINGCDSVVTMILTVNPIYEVSDAQTICASELPYIWNNVQFTEAGTQTTTLQTVKGCDSVVTMTLTVNPLYNVTEERTVCAAALPYTWNEVIFTEAGIQTTTLQSVNNCDSVVTMILSVNTTYNVTDTKSICFDELPFTWNGVTFTEAGTQSVTLTAANDCDSVVTMILTVNMPTEGDTTAVVCGSFDWYEMHLTQSGDYTHTLTNAAGCDSTVTLHLTVNMPTEGDTAAVVCESFDWYGAHLTQSGDYTHTMTNSAGCDSVVTLHLTVNTPTEGDTTAIVCGSFDWYGMHLTQSGEYTHTLTNVAGCDSIVTLHLTVNILTEGDTTAIVCGSFDWYGMHLTQSGDYYHTLTNGAGCDSVVTLHLTVNTPTEGDTTAIVCESFDWYGMHLTQSGDYTHILTNAAGCDSVVILHLTVNTPTEGDTIATVCGSFDWYGMHLTQSGEYTHTLTNVAGCDSIVTLHLTVNILTEGDTAATVCGNFDWYGMHLTQSGEYTHTLTNAAGCDSTVTLHLTVNMPTEGDTAAVVCESFDWYGAHLTQSGDYTHILTNAAGCDSVVILHLTVNTPTEGDTTAVVCGSFDWYGMHLTQTGDYTHTLTNAAGCDSTVTLHLTVNMPTEGDTTATVCGNFDWYGAHLTQTGDYTHMMTNSAGCDSVVTLHLTVNTPTEGDTAAVVCESFDWYGAHLTQSGDYTHILTNAAGCDSVVILHLTVNTPTEGDTTAIVCESFDWYGAHLTQTGDYTHTLTNVAGCDSVVTLHLTIKQTTTGTDVQTACGSYTWIDGVTYTESNNTATYTLVNAAGCDSIVTLNLTINQPTTGIDVQTACGSYTWIDGVTYTESNSTATYTLTNALGCDSVVTLNLNINQPVTTTSTVTICDNELPYVWNGLAFNEAGTQSLTMQAANGCDSVIEMTLIVNPTVTIDAYLTLSDNDLPFTYGDTTFMPGTVQSGDYIFNFTTADGCDSIIILHLTVETGVSSYDLNANMKVYPNPTSGVLNVELTTNNVQSGDVKIQVYDVYGKLLDIVETQNLASQTTQIDMSRYSSGVYFIKAVDGDRLLGVQKVVKQ